MRFVATSGSSPVLLRGVREEMREWDRRCAQLPGLSDAEREEVRRAVLFSGLRFAVLIRAAEPARSLVSALVTFAMFAFVWLAEEGIAFAVLRHSIAAVALALDVWAGAAAGWLLVAFGLSAVWERLTALRHRDWWHVWGRGGLPAIGLGLIGLGIVLFRIWDAAAVHREQALLHLGAVALGGVGGVAVRRIGRTGHALVDRLILVLSARIRPRDDLLTDLTFVAYLGAAALTGRGRDSWRDRDVVRRYERVLDRVAANIERAAGLGATVHRWDVRTRAHVREPYAAVAAVIRIHRVKVLAAQDESQWRAIAESLASGVLAAARLDWAALTANAPAPGPNRRSRLARMARQLSTSAALLACAVVLPQVLQLGAYASSLRAILSVSAVLALLPSDAGGIVRDTLSKALPGR